MNPLSAVYVRMNALMEELGTIAVKINREIAGLRDRARPLSISWTGTAYEAYSRRLLSDIEKMERTSTDIMIMSGLLYISLSRYQETEMKVADIIGGLGR